ncbi:MAG: hypothetical protein Q9219_007455 [cf. Caloplaca sp. 3 TL-2023]
MSLTTPSVLLQTFSIAASLLAAGGTASFTIFIVPSLLALPASRSLPQIRWLFSRGSHIFPTAAALSSAGFVSLAFLALPDPQRNSSLPQRLLGGLLETGVVQGYTAAAVLCAGIGPFTALMVPTNFELIRMNEDKGGTRSERSAAEKKDGGGEKKKKQQSGDNNKDKALSSVGGEGQASEWKDLSGPQGKVEGEVTGEDDEKVKKLLETFGTMNMVRAVLLGGGGIVGLLTALA